MAERRNKSTDEEKIIIALPIDCDKMNWDELKGGHRRRKSDKEIRIPKFFARWSMFDRLLWNNENLWFQPLEMIERQ